MSTELAARIDPAIVQQVLLSGDLRQLTPQQKVAYYGRVCDSLGLNPLTQPFAYIVLNGKEQLYARKECTDQLRRLHAVSLQIVSRDIAEGCYLVQARATMPDGRQDDSIGAVPIENLKGESRANAMMKAETKAKRRATLSICGLGILDESEIEGLAPSLNDQVQAAAATLPPPATWADKPPAVAETLRQALRETGGRPATPPPVPSTAGEAVRVIKLLPPPSRSDARGHLQHSGSDQTLPYYTEQIEQQLKEAQAAGVPVLLDIKKSKTAGLYIAGIREADPF